VPGGEVDGPQLLHQRGIGAGLHSLKYAGLGQDLVHTASVDLPLGPIDVTVI
jgi:hypothetical protein